MTTQEKFLQYCPNCNNYDESSGVCSYIHENVLEYPDKFVKFCDGKYLSLIKGKTIKPVKVSEIGDEDEAMLVLVFSTNNNALFQVAKSLLDDNRIEYFSSGDFVNVLNPAVYGADIKVFEKDEENARKLLSQLKPAPYEPSSEFEKNIISQRWYWYVAIMLLMLLIILGILYFLNNSK